MDLSPFHSAALEQAKILPKNILTVKELYQQVDDDRRQKKKEEEEEEKNDNRTVDLTSKLNAGIKSLNFMGHPCDCHRIKCVNTACACQVKPTEAAYQILLKQE
eukprot:5395884-Ditylum_brightwellii.AAC.1